VPIADLLAGEQRDRVVADLRAMIRSYRAALQPDRRRLLAEFEFADMARQVVGVGSVGTRSWMVLLTGRDQDDPLVLQVQEAQHSVLERFTGRSRFANRGERVVAGQRLLQATPDAFLGWDRVTGVDGVARDFYVRQLHDRVASIDIDRMSPQALTVHVRLCGQVLAAGHARGGDRIALASYLGSGDAPDRPNAFDRAMAEFSVSYADQNERDHAALVRAIADGRVSAHQEAG
jgi:uncharacterized protein (DUF2252 family)